MYAIDFYLGSEIGLWFIHNEKFLDSDRFFTKDEQIMKVIERRNKIRGLGEKPLRAMSVHWPDKFDINTIEKYEYFMNIHPGYLPMGRGTYPIFWSIYLNQTAGVSVHQITPKIDHGPILARSLIPFSENESAGELWSKVFKLEKQMLKETVKKLRFDKSLHLNSYPTEKVGPNRKKIEFENLRDQPDFALLSDSEIQRLILAFTHPKFDLPDWVRNRQR
jgi:methionyl-tRNA formyltransferase